jgi:hypothetical protein
MPAEVIMPALGMAQETGKVLRWLKAEGENVVKGEPLLEIETDKVTVELEACARPKATRFRSGRRSRSCSPPGRACPRTHRRLP